MKKRRVLFLCTGNSARSQMAEGLLRHLGSDRFEIFSAGVNPTRINPLAIKVMDEIGVGISGQKSKSVNEFLEQKFDYVITVCGNAKETCPAFSGKYEKVHWNLEDPAQAEGEEAERLEVFRKVRNRLKENVIKFLNLPKDRAKLRCPDCGAIQEIDIPGNSCLHFHKCGICHKTIQPTPGSCCVLCAYADKNCPTFVAA